MNATVFTGSTLPKLQGRTEVTCANCDSTVIRCKGLCNPCYQRTWKLEHDTKHGRQPRRNYDAIDLNDFWLWLRDEVKLAQAQNRKNPAKSKA